MPAISAPAPLRVAGQGATPLLGKIDIEGGEAGLFSANNDWVDDFPAIAIELHDWMLPGLASSALFLRCAAEKGRDFINPAGADIVFSGTDPLEIRANSLAGCILYTTYGAGPLSGAG